MLGLFLLTLAVGLFARVVARHRTLAVPIVVALALVLAVSVVPTRPEAAQAAAIVVVAVIAAAATLTVSNMHAGRTNSRRLLTAYRAMRTGTSWEAIRPVMPLVVPALPG